MIGEILELRQLLQNRKLSSNELRALQNRKLRTMIRYAYENVPYYRSLFNLAGLAPDDIRTVEDLRHIPITTKDDLRAAGIERIIAKDIKVSSCISRTTSGTTGKPFTVYFNRSDSRTRRLIEFRTLLSIGFRPQDRLAVLGSPHSHRTRLHQHLGFFRSDDILITLSIEDQIQRLQRIRPTVLWVRPTVLRAILHQVDYRLSQLVRPRILIHNAEVFDEVIKEKIRTDLNLEMFNFYGTVELGRIAAECPAHEGIHVNADHVILECLNGDRLVELGTDGVAVLTALNAFTMPFIRYRLGDICAYMEKTCSCGSNFPLIHPPRGREEDIIRMPNGKIMSSLTLQAVLRNINEIDQYRIIQESYDKLVIQIVFRKTPNQKLFKEIKFQCLRHLTESVKLDIQKVDFIEEEKLKFRAFISKLSK